MARRFSPESHQPVRLELPERGRRLLEPRLWGTWKSDRRKTFEHVVLPKATPAGLRKFRSLFGKLVVTWDETTVSSYFDCDRLNGFPNDRTPTTRRYQVLARGPLQVTVCYLPTASDSEMEGWIENLRPIETIEFDDHGYRVSAGLFLEYFRRLPNA